MVGAFDGAFETFERGSAVAQQELKITVSSSSSERSLTFPIEMSESRPRVLSALRHLPREAWYGIVGGAGWIAATTAIGLIRSAWNPEWLSFLPGLNEWLVFTAGTAAIASLGFQIASYRRVEMSPVPQRRPAPERPALQHPNARVHFGPGVALDVRSELLPLPWKLLSDSVAEPPQSRSVTQMARFAEGRPHIVHFKMWVTAPAGVLPDISLTIRNGDLVGKAVYEVTQLAERRLVSIEPLPETAAKEWTVRLMDGVQGKSWSGSFLFNGVNRSEPRTWWLRSGDRELASGSFGLGESPKSFPPPSIAAPEPSADGTPIPGRNWP